MTRLDLADRPGPDHDRGNDWTSIGEWSKAIARVGIPGAIAIFLVYIGATRIPQVERQLQTLLAKQEEIIRNQGQILTLLDELVRVAQRACSNAASDDTARQRCFDR